MLSERGRTIGKIRAQTCHSGILVFQNKNLRRVSIHRALRFMNRAARRMELDAVAVADAARIGTEFLTEITTSSRPKN